jgi:mono/diheme cytochrome c family protein
MRTLEVVIVGALAAAILAASCGDKGGEKASGKPANGAEIYASIGCTLCHGKEGAGTGLGPTLAGAGARWERADLVEYLKNPPAYTAKDARLTELKKSYSMPMPPYASTAPEQLEALADFVMSRP